MRFAIGSARGPSDHDCGDYSVADGDDCFDDDDEDDDGYDYFDDEDDDVMIMVLGSPSKTPFMREAGEVGQTSPRLLIMVIVIIFIIIIIIIIIII